MDLLQLVYPILRVSVLRLLTFHYHYLVEGAVTVIYGIVCLFFMPHTPAETKFLTDDEKHLAMHRMKEDGHGAVAVEDVREEKFNWHWVWMACKAPQTILSSLTWIFMLIPLYVSWIRSRQA